MEASQREILFFPNLFYDVSLFQTEADNDSLFVKVFKAYSSID